VGGDRLSAFSPLITGIRWGTLAIGMVVAQAAPRGTVAALAWGLVLCVYALARTAWPLRWRPGRRSDMAALVADLILAVAAVMATDGWSSPYLFCLTTAVVAIGFVGGLRVASAVAAGVVAALAGSSVLTASSPDPTTTLLGASVLLLVGYVAGYARTLFGEAEARTTMALDRVNRLSEANELLQELHRVAQTLPASLDLGETVGSTAARLVELIRPDIVVILLKDESGPGWTVATARGAKLGPALRDDDMPGPVRAAAGLYGAVLVDDLQDSGGPGLSDTSRAGLYAALRARGTLVGLLAVECREPSRLTAREAELIEGLAEQTALALDNARWFARLRTVGANEERTRIARDLHDRVGQSLAYLAFELDRICRQTVDPAVKEELGTLRHDVRNLVGEVRDTLHDLRTDVSESRDLGVTLEAFLARAGRRAGVEVSLRSQAASRLPLPQERELWRIAQEAITNAMRHAKARCVTVTWRCTDDGASLEVADDGMGFPPGVTPTSGTYGITGMRERADAIGAALEIESSPGVGTTVRCRTGNASRLPAVEAVPAPAAR
jgi:signal transduction histidine kinase